MTRALAIALTGLLLGACVVPRGGTRPGSPDGGASADAPPPDAGPPDRDGDGVPDPSDDCPDAANPEQLDLDADGLGDACDPDRDGDGVEDLVDVCPDLPDPEQLDLDRDDVGDLCDPDVDGDLIPNERDLCPELAARSPDEDGDGVSDACDACPLDFDPDQENADGDRLGDACEDPDPTRFSRVAYLQTFRVGPGDLVAEGDGWMVMNESMLAIAPDEQTLTRPQDADLMGQRFAVHVVGRYLGPEGDPADGAFGVLLRWTQRPEGRFGYGMEVLAESDRVSLTRHDGSGCGALMDEECVVPLIDRALGIAIGAGDPFTLRATAFDDALTLALRTPSGTTTHGVTDVRHAVGGFGLRVREARVRFGAIAVYAP